MRVIFFVLLFYSTVFSKIFEVDSYFHKGIHISTHFLKKDTNLSQTYIKKSIYYIDMYEKMIGKFPYDRFGIVASKEQVGYSKPTYTVIGDRLLNKPFLVDISLGHEILHQYFGDSIFNDFEKGNWVEGITTYLADHYYKELKNQDIEHRKNILHDYSIFVDEKTPTLKEFKQRVDRASMLVGYERGANIFHTIRKNLGDEKFFKLLREFYKKYKFKYVTFEDIKKHFGVDFDFLLNTNDLIELNITDLDTKFYNDSYHVEFKIGSNANILLPIWVNDSEKFSIKVDKDIVSKITLSLKTEPKKIVFDKEYDLFRSLTPDEKPINLASLFDKNSTIIGQEAKKFQKIFTNAKTIKKDELTFSILKNNNLIFLKDSLDLANKIVPNLKIKKDGFFISSIKNPFNSSKIITVIYTKDDDEFKKVKRKLKHYLRYSKLYFKNGKIIQKESLKTQNGIIFNLSKDQAILQVPNSLTFDKLIESLNDKKVIYVGEAHDNFAHHINQLKVIRALYNKGKKVSIGMEMFQKPYQSALDDYINSKIDEREFLKRSEYFKRWGFDYNLYKPILDFARENNIPVVALNIPKEIIKKITKGGFLSLDKNDTKHLPKKIDFSNKEYKTYLKNFFNSSMHKEKTKDKNVDFIYQSQIVWDESMAEGVSEFLSKNPDYVMVVIAGNGHLQSGFGIPQRVYRDTSLEYSIILQDIPIKPKVADFVLYPQKLNYKKALKLGVYLDKDTLKIMDVIKDSLANKLGVLKDDVILEIDQVKVKNLYDLKLELFFKDKNSDIVLKVKRKNRILTLNRL